MIPCYRDNPYSLCHAIFLPFLITNTSLSSYEAVSDKIRENLAGQKEMERFIEILSEQEPVTEFDGVLWAAMVDHMTVNNPKDIVITFRDGTEIKENMDTK